MTATPAPISGLLNFGDFIFNIVGGATRADEFDVSFTGFNQPVQISLNSPNLVAYTPLVQIINANTNAVLVSGVLNGNNSVIANFLPQFNTPYKIRVTSTAAINTTVAQAYTLVVNGIAGDIVLNPRLTTFNTAASSTSTILAPATQTGVLNNQDFTFPAPRTGFPSLADEYDFDFTAPNQPIQISLVSANTTIYDPFLQVINARTGAVIVADDDSGEGLNSLITNFMPEGGADYRIRVSSFNALTLPSAESFAYTLQASAGAGQQVTLTPRSQNSPVEDPVYRFFKPQTGGHFFTVDATERDTVLANPSWGYNYEGVGFEASVNPGINLFPVYRFFKPQTGGHFFTIDPSERDTVIANPQWGYNNEGIGFYAYGSSASLGSDVFRFFKPQTGGHFFTINPSERDTVLANPGWGYNYEGVGFEAAVA